MVVGEEWLNLPVEKVVEIISADELEVEREEHVFGAATAWLHHSYQARAPTFHKVIVCVGDIDDCILFWGFVIYIHTYTGRHMIMFFLFAGLGECETSPC